MKPQDTRETNARLLPCLCVTGAVTHRTSPGASARKPRRNRTVSCSDTFILVVRLAAGQFPDGGQAKCKQRSASKVASEHAMRSNVSARRHHTCSNTSASRHHTGSNTSASMHRACSSMSASKRARLRGSTQEAATRARGGIAHEAARAQVCITHAGARAQVSTTHAATRAQVKL